MPGQDKKIRWDILKWLYDQFEESPRGRWSGEDFLDDLKQEFDEDDVVYNVERMDGELLEKDSTMGSRIYGIHILPEGIERLHSEGYNTILDSENRYDILEILYQADRGNPGFAYLSKEEIADELDIDRNTVDQNIWYLKEKRLVDERSGSRDVGITDSGRSRYEQYLEDGTGIPRTESRSSLRQASIGPQESGKAENLFRDFVELSKEEVIIVDRFAREGLYDLLEHVPSGVEIKVITTDRVMSQGYQQRVNQYRQQHSSVEVRYLSDDNWNFHDRYIIRDREDAWAWGHSFHDAGDTQHTASELKPINREQIIDQFESAWKNGSVIK